MTPSPLVALVLTLAAFRVVRLIGWDDLPPVVRLRGWALGETATWQGSTNAALGLTNEPGQWVTTYRRPLLAHLVHCPFCVGFWVSAAVYAAWALEPSWTLYGAVPLALSAAVGLIAKNLDP